MHDRERLRLDIRETPGYLYPIRDKGLSSRILLMSSREPPAEGRDHVFDEDNRPDLSYRLLADSAWNWVYWLGTDRRFVYVSPSAEHITGYPPAAFLADAGLLRRIIHPEDLPAWLEHERQPDAVGGGPPQSAGGGPMEFRIIRRDGEIRWVSHACRTVTSPGGASVGRIASNHDITGRKAAEEALRASEERLRLASLAAELGVFEWDVKSDMARWENDRMYEIFGRSRAEGPLSRQAFYADVLISEDRPAFEAALNEAVQPPGRLLRTACRIRRRSDGAARWIEISARFELAADGTAERLIGVVADITERNEVQEALLRAKTELEQKVQERTALLAQRARQLRALAGELTLTEQRERRRMARLLHDHLQQLLVGAKFRTTILGRSADEVVREAAAEIEQLLDESIKASRSLTAELSPPILHEGGLLPGLEWLARWTADKHGLVVDLGAKDDLPALAEDVAVLLFESVRELLFNAVKHARVRSVNVNVRPIGKDEVQITVSDAGPGFDPSRVNLAGETVGGVPPKSAGGFGLFGIRERLDLIGGRLEIDSAPGRGSRFTLTAPVRRGEAPPAAELAPAIRAAVQQAVQPSEPKAGAAIRVMLADDHAVVREGLARLLDAEPDIDVVGEAADGKEAVELAGEVAPDVILMDLSMPRMNGEEATRAIRMEHPQIRVIGLSMYEEAEGAEALRKAGAADYLTKSGPSRDLVAAIRRCMDRPNAPAG